MRGSQGRNRVRDSGRGFFFWKEQVGRWADERFSRKEQVYVGVRE